MQDGEAGGHERILVTTDALGGVWQYATDLSAGLVRHGVEVVLAVMGPARAPFHPPGMEVIETGLALDWTARDARELADMQAALRDLAGRTGVTSVHLHAPALLGDVPRPVPSAVVAHSCMTSWWDAVKGGDLPPDLVWRHEAALQGLRGADAVVAPSHAFARDVRRLYGFGRPDGPDAIEVIYNGRATGPCPARPTGGAVLTAGRLWDEGKDAALLDAVAARLPIRAAGPVDGPGVSARFTNLTLLGTLSADGLAQERAAAAVFVSVPRYEPFGLAVLEAAQSGLPLVLSDIPTLRELWDGAAEFVPTGDAAALERTLRRVLDDPGTLGPRAAARASRYTVRSMIDRTLALHREIATRDARTLH